MRRHSLLLLAVASWTLLYSRHGTEWLRLGEYTSSGVCSRILDARVAEEAHRAIGSALAAQPADNPMRQRALSRAWKRVQPRFRCVYRR